ncbi:MAG: DNA internalization-related competence protein ComEC/Rec2 [Firmicutes bacterium]|nr:DNA internalization-related competence protein ComEC/Rec2 [Bacillota bacterium]
MRQTLSDALKGRQLMLLALSFAAGIYLAARAGFTPLPLLLLALVLLAAYAALRRHPAALALLLTAALCCGIAAAEHTEQRLAVPLPDTDIIALEGRVTESSWQTENSTVLRLRPELVNGEPWRGADIYIYYNGAPLAAGARIYAEGRCFDTVPAANKGSFDYGLWLQRQGVSACVACYDVPPLLLQSAPALSDMAGLWRLRLDAQLAQLPAERQALVRGIFLGDKSGLDYAARETLSLAGVMHAFAVSGLHVGYIAAAALWLAGSHYRRRWLRVALTALFLLFYLTLTGFSASICRAAIMSLVLVLAGAVHEKNDLPTSLSLAALVCLIWKPLWLFDAGFQLSFAAVAGLMLLLPLFRRLIPADYFYRFPKAVYEGFVVSVAASFATMPLISYYFSALSPVGWLVSPLFVWGAGAVVLLSFGAAFLCLFVPAAALPLLLAAGWVADALYRLCLWALRLPYAYLLSGTPALWQVVLACVLLMLLPLLFARRLFGKRRLAAWLMLALIFCLCFAPQVPTDELELTMLDVGQGDALLIRTPGGRVILLDGGGNSYDGGYDADIGPYVLLPYLKSRGIDSIDIVISSHAHADHYSGLLAVLAQLPVGEFWYAPSAEAAQLQLLDAAAANGAEIVALEAGMSWEDAEDLRWQVWAPDEVTADNASSLILGLSFGAVDMLFTGDAEAEQLQALASRLPAYEVLKVPHHGSHSSYSPDFYAAVRAQVALISVGADNSYGHPADSVVEYWQSHGARVCRTDVNGQISLFTDGQSWRIITYK